MPRNNDAKTSTMVVTLDGYASAWVKFLSPPCFNLLYPKKGQVSKHFFGGSLITVPTVRLFLGGWGCFFLEICCKPFLFRASKILYRSVPSFFGTWVDSFAVSHRTSPHFQPPQKKRRVHTKNLSWWPSYLQGGHWLKPCLGLLKWQPN